MPRSPLLALGIRFAIALALAAGVENPAFARGRAPLGPFQFSPPAFDGPPSVALGPQTLGQRVAAPERMGGTMLYPTYHWPMERPLGDGLYCANFVDHDASAGILDYAGGAWTYDTHRGTDISLFDFKAMDRGFRILAAAPGTVTSAVWANARDRNCAQADNPTLNYIEVANGDGTFTYYYHLRANSMTVNVGEAVATGEVLGMAGSSGYSFGPHLHFEPADWLGGPYVPRDPFNGPANPSPSLWASQPPYSGTQPFQALDMGVVTQASAGGNIFSVDYCGVVAERFQEPVTVGLDEPYVGIWLYPLGHAGDSYTLELHAPDGSMWESPANYTLSADLRGGYQYWIWDLAPWATQTGTWRAKMFHGTTLIREHDFQVSATTSYGPRFVRGGRSFRINGAVQRDTLLLGALGAAGSSITLINAPSFVSLAGSIVTVGPTSDQPYRSSYFQAVVTNGIGERDTAWYHVVDPGKPQNPIVAAGDGPRGERLELGEASPNPSSDATTLQFTLPRAGRVSLALFDVEGRRVCTLYKALDAPAGSLTVRWNGRDDADAPTPTGVYLARLAFDRDVRIRRIVHIR